MWRGGGEVVRCIDGQAPWPKVQFRFQGLHAIVGSGLVKLEDRGYQKMYDVWSLRYQCLTGLERSVMKELTYTFGSTRITLVFRSSFCHHGSEHGRNLELIHIGRQPGSDSGSA